MFVDTANGDYTLQMDSPLIDAGHPDSTDADGTIADIGAYYYDQSGQPKRVQGFVTTPTDSSEIILTWDALSPEPDHYAIYRHTDKNADFYSLNPHISSVAGNAITIIDDNQLSEDITYHYRIRGIDSDGDEGLLALPKHGRLASDSTSLRLDNSYATVENITFLPTGSPLTLEGFFKLIPSTNDETQVIGFPTEIVIHQSGSNDSIQLRLYHWNTPTNETFIIDTSWHHIAFTSETNETKIWVDGFDAMSIPSVPSFSSFDIGPNSGTEETIIVDELKFSNIVRYNTGFIPINDVGMDENTIGYWQFNEGSLDANVPAAYDWSGNGLHMEIMGVDLSLSGYVGDAPQWTDTENALVINEIMQNPNGADTGKEWIELYNNHFTPLHLENFSIKGHTISADMNVPVGGYAVLAASDDTTANAGLYADYSYDGAFTLGNGGDEIILLDGSGNEINRVAYDGGPVFPDPSGASMELIAPYMDNNVGTSWTEGILSYGTNGNLGSPGRKNDAYSGAIVLAETALGFGNVVEGETGDVTLMIYNEGVKELHITEITAGLDEFSADVADADIAPNDSLEVTVTFAPEIPGAFVDTLHIFSDDPDDSEVIVALSGMGVADAADIAVLDDVTDLDFPDTRVGYPRDAEISVTNMGNQTLNIDEILIEGDDAFSTDIEDGSLAFMDTLTVTVTFDPQTDGDFSANLLFTSDDPDEGTVTIPLTGSAATNITLYVPTEFTTIQSAIDTAYSGDTIQVAAGTYQENILFPADEDFVLRGEGADVTILDGNGAGSVITLTSSQTAATQISHLAVTNGNAATGGGIAAFTASPVISHVVVYENEATTSGGGIYLEGNATLGHVTVSGNTSAGNGDGIYAGSGTVEIKNSILWNNGEQEIEATGATTLTYSIIDDDTWLSGEGNINEDPNFSDEGNGDFSLNWGSPAIDTGDPTTYDTDGSRADMGALPYSGGVPDISTDDALDFGDVLMGDTGTESFTIHNLGTVDLFVDSITIDNAAFSLSESSSRPEFALEADKGLPGRKGRTSLIWTAGTIDPGDSVEIAVDFSSEDLGMQTGTITVHSDDPDGDDSSSLSGTMVAPIASLPANSITAVTYIPQNTSFSFALDNLGDAELDWSLEIDADYFGFIWMEAAETSGQVSADSSVEISVNIQNTENLDAGGYNGAIYLSTNTLVDGDVPDEPQLSDTIDVFLNLLADSSQYTVAEADIPSGNAPPVEVTDSDGNPVGVLLDFINSGGGTVTVTRIDASPPVDTTTPYTDPDATITDPAYNPFYFEISTDITGAFAVDIGFNYGTIPGIQNPDSLRMGRRVSNAGTSVILDIVSAANTEINVSDSSIVIQNQTGFSQWVMLSNASANSFADNQGPAISNISLSPSAPAETDDITITADLSDVSGVNSATLYFAKASEWAFSNVGMTVVTGQASAAIPGANVTMDGLVFYVTADDALSNASTSDTSYVEVSIADGSLTTNSVNSSAHASGIPIDKWRIIGPPAVLADNNLTSNIGDELGTQSDDVWRMFSYNANTQAYAEKPTTFAAASSYWLYQRVSDNLHFALGAASTGDLEGTSITLVPGWTFISSPYPFPVDIDLSQTDFYGPITYGEGAEDWSGVVTTLKPWGGYAVYNRNSANATITILPDDPSSSLIAAKAEEENGWILNLKAQSGDYADRNNRLGALESAEDGLDHHDNPALIPPGRHIFMTYTNPAWGEGTVLTSDVRRNVSDEIHMWDIDLRANGINDPIEITWEMEQPMEAGMGIRLIDLRTQTVVNPLTDAKLTVEQVRKEFPVHLKAVAGPEAQVESAVEQLLASLPQSFTLKQNYPNPFNANTMIRFGLPEPANVRLTIVNLLGQEIAEITSGWYDLGFHEVRWNGMTLANEPAASGVYFSVLTNGEAVDVKKLILMK